MLAPYVEIKRLFKCWKLLEMIKGLSYFAREYSSKTSWVDLFPRIMVSMATQHAGTDQKCLTKKWSVSCKAAEQVTLLAGSEMRATKWAAVDLMSSSSSCSKHKVELRTLETQVKKKIPLVGKLIADYGVKTKLCVFYAVNFSVHQTWFWYGS